MPNFTLPKSEVTLSLLLWFLKTGISLLLSFQEDVDEFRHLMSILCRISPALSQRLILKKVGKTTRPCRCDLNQIPDNYTMQVTRFKGLDLIECLKNYGQRFLTFYRRWWSYIIPKKKKYKKVKWLSKEVLQIAEKRREVKGKGEKERYIHLNAGFQRTARRDKKVFLSWSMQRNRGEQQTDDGVQVMHSICQQIWKTQQWPQDWKRLVFFFFFSFFFLCFSYL